MQAASRAHGSGCRRGQAAPLWLSASVVIDLQSVALIQVQLQEAGTSRWLGH